MQLPESENYITTIGYSEEFKRVCYQIVNRHTDVVEMETTVMGYAIEGVDQLESMLSGKESGVDLDRILQ